MLFFRSLLLTLCLSAAPALAEPQDIAALAVAPNASLEAETARELNAIAPAIVRRRWPDDGEEDKKKLALAFANLGRVEVGIRVANTLEDQDPIASNSAPLTRDEVRDIVARRRAVLGKVPEAVQVANEIQNPRLHANALLSIARAQTRIGNKAEAQKTLFQALKLVEKERDAQVYIAVLLDRADEPGAAKRLLDRVEKALAPIVPPKYPSLRTMEELRLNGEWRHLAWALFQTGQEEKSANIDFATRGNYLPSSMSTLVLRGEADLAEKLARQNKDERNQWMLLQGIAWGLRTTQPERAKALALEVSERIHKTPPGSEPSFKGSSYPSEENGLLTSVASLLRELGQEDQAQTLLREVIDSSGVKAAAHARLAFALAPLTFETNLASFASVAPRYTKKEIERISKEVNEGLNSANISQFDAILPRLVDAQIETGLTDLARQTLTILEEKTFSDANLRPIDMSSDSDVLNPALDIAKAWKKLGDTQRADKFLNRLWNSPFAKDIPPRERAWKFIAYGFVNEGRARLKTLGIGPQEPLYQYSSLAYFEGKFDPQALPDWLGKVLDPHKRLAVLSDFSQGLTESLFNSRPEREFSLTEGGSRHAISY